MNWDTATHYEVLQVASTASLPVIKASYRALIQQYHPDRYTPTDEAERITKRLNEAFKVLSDNELRAAYDEFLNGQPEAKKPKEPPPHNTSTQHNSDPERKTSLGWSFWVWLVAFAVLGKLFGYLAVGAGLATFHLLQRYGKGPQFAGAALVGGATLLFSIAALPYIREWGAGGGSRTEIPGVQQPAAQPIQQMAKTEPPTDPRDALLQMHVEQLSNDQYNAAVNRWLESHPEASSAESRTAMSQLLQEVYTQYPRSALGPALDMALQRGQRNNSSPTGQTATQSFPAGCIDYTSTEIPARYNGRRFTLNFRNVPLRKFLNIVEQESNRRIILQNDSSSEITTCVINVPWDYALDKILADNGYGQTEYNGSIRVFKR